MALFEFGDYSYQEITLKEKLLEVLSYLLRIGDFKQYAGKTNEVFHTQLDNYAEMDEIQFVYSPTHMEEVCRIR